MKKNKKNIHFCWLAIILCFYEKWLLLQMSTNLLLKQKSMDNNYILHPFFWIPYFLSSFHFGFMSSLISFVIISHYFIASNSFAGLVGMCAARKVYYQGYYYKTGPSEKHSVSRPAQHAALHKAYKPVVSATHVCPSISNLLLWYQRTLDY